LLTTVPVFPILEEDNVRTGFFEEHERRAILDTLPKGFDALAAFLSLTGWRLGEALALTWPQVDFSAGVIRLEPRTTKNSEGRTFPFVQLPELHVAVHESPRSPNRCRGARLPHSGFCSTLRPWTHRPFSFVALDADSSSTIADSKPETVFPWTTC